MAGVKKLFRLVIHADEAQFLSPYEKKAETDLDKKHLEAYETRSVPPEARKPFLGSVAEIRRNQRIADRVLPDVDRWIAARPS